MPTRSAISSAIANVWVDMNTVIPSRVRAASRSFTIRTLRGSSPTIGSSSTRTSGSWSSDAANTSRCFMPSE